MRSIAAFAFLLAAIATPASYSFQSPKTEPSVVGVWVLKSVTVDGKDAPMASKEFPGLLENFGGAEIGAFYKFRKDGGCSLNDDPAGYEYIAETRELSIDHDGQKGKDDARGFDVGFANKNMKLICKDKGRKVELLLTPDE